MIQVFRAILAFRNAVVGEGNGNPFQYSCLENPMDRGAWEATVHGVTRLGHDLVTNRFSC